MRNVGSLVPFALFLVAACSSTPKRDATDTQTPGESPAGSEVGEQTNQEQFDEDVERLELKQQKKRFLVEEHVRKARELMELSHFEEAQVELAQALELEPDDLTAKQLAADVGAMLGRPAGERETFTQIMQDEFRVRVQQLRADAEDNLRRAKFALGRGDYDAAIAELTLCLNHVRWAPYAIDWQGIDKEAQQLLDRAQAERSAATDAELKKNRETALAALREAEERERVRRDEVISNILVQSIDAFDAGEYDQSMEFAEEVLEKDPRNEKAQELRDSAFRAGRKQVREDYLVNKREQFSLWREQIEKLKIPWTDVMTLPDRARWQQITAIRKQRHGLDLAERFSPSDLALRQSLKDTFVVLPGINEEESLQAVVAIIRQYTGLPLVVDPAAEQAVLDEGVVFNLNLENQLSVEQALNLITSEAKDTVTWVTRHDAVLVTTKEKARGKPEVQNHDVQDLVFGLTDFTGPRIDRIRLLDELEDEDGGGPFGGILESPHLIEIDELATLIQTNVAVGTWDQDGVSIEPGEGFVTVVHSPEVQDEVRAFLEDLRRFNSSLVTIESKFMTVGDNWIQQIGVDFRGLDNADISDVTNGLEDMAGQGIDNGGSGSAGQGAAGPPSSGFFYDDGQDGDFRGRTENFFDTALGKGLSTIGGLTYQLTFLNDLQLSAILRAIEKSSEFQLINSQLLSVHNTQRAYVTVINQQAYIQDFDVEVAQFQAVADPQINVLHEGVVLDVRPTINHNRRYITLEIQPTVAKIVALRNFSSSLGGNTSPVEFQLPEVEVQSVNTSAILPDGGSILLGGLSSLRNIERRAEVPWLAHIPILGFLFKEEGYSDEKESLMILIRARIDDVREMVSNKLETAQ